MAPNKKARNNEYEQIVLELSQLKTQYEQIVEELRGLRNDNLVLKQLYADSQVVGATATMQLKQLVTQNQLLKTEIDILKTEKSKDESAVKENK